MKKIILAAILTLSTFTAVKAADDTGFYVGGNVGTTINNKQRVDLGFNTGYQISPFVRGELTYDYRKFDRSMNNVMVNAIVQYPTGTPFTPYVLAGTGISVVGTQSEMAYNVGGGLRVAVSDNVELDTRYRYTDTFRANAFRKAGDNSFTLGVNFRF
jgi:hypothetical protein